MRICRWRVRFQPSWSGGRFGKTPERASSRVHSRDARNRVATGEAADSLSEPVSLSEGCRCPPRPTGRESGDYIDLAYDMGSIWTALVFCLIKTVDNVGISPILIGAFRDLYLLKGTDETIEDRTSWELPTHRYGTICSQRRGGPLSYERCAWLASSGRTVIFCVFGAAQRSRKKQKVFRRTASAARMHAEGDTGDGFRPATRLLGEGNPLGARLRQWAYAL